MTQAEAIIDLINAPCETAAKIASEQIKGGLRGDVENMIGAMIGWQGILFTLFAASTIGTIVGLLAMIRSGDGMRLAIPFGPFLSLGALISLFWGSSLIHWYLHVF